MRTWGRRGWSRSPGEDRAIGKLKVCENGLGEPGGLQGTQGWGRWSTLETADYILRMQMGRRELEATKSGGGGRGVLSASPRL